MAREAKHFTFEDVAAAIGDKLIRRHPHIFGEVTVEDAAHQTRLWEEQKARERAEKAAAQGRAPSVLDGVSTALPAMTRAVKLQNRAARVGFDWDEAAQVVGKIDEELDELKHEVHHPARDLDRVKDELGDLLFAAVNLARKLDLDPETALRHTNMKFERRFRHIETALAGTGRSPAEAGLDEMEALWQEAKAAEPNR